MQTNSTICSISTPAGVGAVAIVRVSGNDSFNITAKLFKNGADFLQLSPNMMHFFKLYALDHETLVDQVMVVKFQNPRSYTGEDMVEISCHGSLFIQRKIVELLIEAGCRMAKPGEFTMRAFLNGKIDLPQAEAIADLIDSQTDMSHKLAINQLSGNVSLKLSELRQQLLQFSALLELELDFSEEDVQFADRRALTESLSKIQTEVGALLHSFKLGNVLKNGIPVAIIGKPNVGKSTLLNRLLDNDRAIVSHIPGTTRDTIEDTLNIQGITFRFVDTAGIRMTEDEVENIGIERTFQAIEKADIILYLIDVNHSNLQEIAEELQFLENEIDFLNKKIVIVANKIDEMEKIPSHLSDWNDYDVVFISAKRGVNINYITDILVESVNNQRLSDEVVLTNARHYESLSQILGALQRIAEGLESQRPTELLAIDLRAAVNAIGEVTGEVTSDEVLNSIFGRFCIGK